MLNIVVAGYDEESGCQLYTMDFLGACLRVPYAAHGLGGYLSWGILDHYYRPGKFVTRLSCVLIAIV